jgi:hypothetical protein
MQTLLKLNQSVVIVILLTTSLCLHSKHSYAQGLLDKIKKAQEDVKKTTDEAKKIKNDLKKQVDDVKQVTGTGSNNGNGNGSSNNNNNNNSSTNTNTENNSSEINGPRNLFGTTIPNSDQDFVKKITITNATGREIYIRVTLYDGKKDISNPLSFIKPIVCGAGKQLVVDLVACAERSYFVLGSQGETVTKTVAERGKYTYQIQANFDDGLGRGEGKPDAFSTIVFGNGYTGDDLKKISNVVKVEISPLAMDELARKAKQEEANKNANDPTKVGTLTIVNAVGGKGKIYCVLRVPLKSTSGSYKKVEFMLGENKGDQYVIKDLRLFRGYDLRTMPESEKGKDPLNGISYITNSVSGRGGANTFQMEDSIIANVGVGENR